MAFRKGTLGILVTLLVERQKGSALMAWARDSATENKLLRPAVRVL